MAQTVLVVSDLHYPFAHRDHMEFLQAVNEAYEPDEVVCSGDEVDHHAISDWDHDPDGYSPGDELKHALKDLHRLYDVFPEVKVCVSNHTARPFRRAKKYGIPRAYLRDYKEFLEAPDGWSWALKHEIDGVIYEHGEGLSGPLGAIRGAANNMQSTVIGHLHANAGVLWGANPKCLYFGMNVGCLLDKDAYAMAYGSHLKNKPVLGVGVVQRGIPTFVPMVLKRGGRWTGRLA